MSYFPIRSFHLFAQSPNSETVPREKMYRITPMYPEDPRAPFYAPGGDIAPLARLYLSREAIVPRSCDEQLLLSQVTEEAENTQSVNRREHTLYQNIYQFPWRFSRPSVACRDDSCG